MDRGQNEFPSNRINYDQNLLNKAKATITGIRTPELEFSGLQTPHILFHGFGDRTRSRKMFASDSLNPDNEFLWFSPGVHRSALAYGMSIEGEDREEIARIGLQHHQEEDHEEWYQANNIKTGTSLALVVFPHEETELGKWLEDKNAISPAFANNKEFITDLNTPLSNTLIVRFSQVQPFIEEIERGVLKTKKEFMEKLGLTEDQQADTRAKLRVQLVHK